MTKPVEMNEILTEARGDIEYLIQQINNKLQNYNTEGVLGYIVIDCHWPGDIPRWNSWKRWCEIVVDQYRKAGWIVEPHANLAHVYFFKFPLEAVHTFMDDLKEKAQAPYATESRKKKSE